MLLLEYGGAKVRGQLMITFKDININFPRFIDSFLKPSFLEDLYKKTYNI